MVIDLLTAVEGANDTTDYANSLQLKSRLRRRRVFVERRRRLATDASVSALLMAPPSLTTATL